MDVTRERISLILNTITNYNQISWENTPSLPYFTINHINNYNHISWENTPSLPYCTINPIINYNHNNLQE